MWRKSIISACVVAVVMMGSVLTHAESISIQNNSFEDTDASASPYYVENAVAKWTTNGYWIATLYNCDSSPHGATYTGVDGNQYLGISSWATSVDQILPQTFEAGKTYKLTVGLAISSSDHNNTDASVAVRLFYGDSEDPATMTANTIGEISKTCGELSTTAFADYSVTVTSSQIAAASAAGKKIGIEIAIPTNAAGANFGVDNVRLDIIPEPSMLILMATGVFGLVAYAWRKRR